MSKKLPQPKAAIWNYVPYTYIAHAYTARCKINNVRLVVASWVDETIHLSEEEVQRPGNEPIFFVVYTFSTGADSINHYMITDGEVYVYIDPAYDQDISNNRLIVDLREVLRYRIAASTDANSEIWPDWQPSTKLIEIPTLRQIKKAIRAYAETL